MNRARISETNQIPLHAEFLAEYQRSQATRQAGQTTVGGSTRSEMISDCITYILRLKTRFLGWIVANVVRLLLLTIRYRSLGDTLDKRGVIAFLHGEQLPLLLHRPRHSPKVAPISLSQDGDLQVMVMRYFGVEAVRGSTSRGAMRVLRSLRRWMQQRDGVILIAVDGPRGPYGVVSPGAPYLARTLKVPYWVCKVHCSRAWRLSSWDRFIIPFPFSRVEVTTTRCEPSVEATTALLSAQSNSN